MSEHDGGEGGGRRDGHGPPKRKPRGPAGGGPRKGGPRKGGPRKDGPPRDGEHRGGPRKGGGAKGGPRGKGGAWKGGPRKGGKGGPRRDGPRPPRRDGQDTRGRGDDRGRPRRERSDDGGGHALDHARDAARSLIALARDLAEARGFGRWERLPVDAVDVHLSLPMEGRDRSTRLVAEELGKRIDQALSEALRAAGAFQQGRVYCFLCESSDCEHAGPGGPAETFLGYASSGKPEWKAFPSVLMERGEERVDRLYEDRPEVIAYVARSGELNAKLVEGLGSGDRAFEVLGQVVAGMVPVSLDPRNAKDDRFCLTLQVVHTTASRGRRLRLNVIGLAPDQLAELAGLGSARGPAESLRRTIHETRKRLDVLGRRAAHESDSASLAEQVEHVLGRLRGDVERVFRGTQRRTKHAEERHEDDARPTGAAMDDVAQAPDDRFFRDDRRETNVVVGGQQRAHIFNDEGRHITSFRLEPGELDRKTKTRRWTELSTEQIQKLKDQLSGGSPKG